MITFRKTSKVEKNLQNRVAGCGKANDDLLSSSLAKLETEDIPRYISKKETRLVELIGLLVGYEGDFSFHDQKKKKKKISSIGMRH